MKRNGVFIPVYTTLLASYGDLLGVPVGGVKYAAKFVSQSWPYSSAPPSSWSRSLLCWLHRARKHGHRDVEARRRHARADAA